MATPSRNRAFQAYNSRNFKNRPASSKPAMPTDLDPLVVGRTSHSAAVQPAALSETCVSTSLPASPGNVVKSTAAADKRCSSITSLSHLLPRPKSLQMTALASQRQSLWISIAKNAQANSSQTTPLPFLRHQQTSLTRKKLLRLLLVFSYLLSISLFAIALATFYGFFWSGYDTAQTANVELPLSGNLQISPNSTFIDMPLPNEDDAVM